MKIRDYYDKLSSRYYELYGEEQGPKHERVLDIMGDRRFEVVLDIGCGDGELLFKIQEKTNALVGLDISEGMLRRAKLLLGERADLVMADGCHLPFREDSIDCVVSVSVADRESAGVLTSEAARVGLSGAKMAVSVLNYPASPAPDLNSKVGVERSVWRRYSLSTHETLFFATKEKNNPMLKNEWKTR